MTSLALADALGDATTFDGDVHAALSAYSAARKSAGQRTMLLPRVMRHAALTRRLRGPLDLSLRAVARFA